MWARDASYAKALGWGKKISVLKNRENANVARIRCTIVCGYELR